MKTQLQGLDEKIKKAFTTSEDMFVEDIPVITHQDNRTYVDKEFLIKYGNVVRMVLREMVWEKNPIKEAEDD